MTKSRKATPNLLILMSDEHQAAALGCAAHPIAQTPNLDRLAARGTRFVNASTNSPICVPARASFATGQYVHRIRCWDNAMPYAGTPRGWGHALQAADVPVESIGKLHYRRPEDDTGFDRLEMPMMVAGGIGMVWASVRDAENRLVPKNRMLGNYIGAGDSDYTRYDSAVTERTVQWFRDRAASADERPWCLYVGLVAPHFPLIAPQAFFDLYPPDTLPEPKLGPSSGYRKHPWVELQDGLFDTEGRFRDGTERKHAMAAYYGLCSFLDHNVGLILDGLEQAGFADDTTVIYTSDHGESLGARGVWGKCNFYEESVAIPMLAAGPGFAPGICRTPVSLVDLSETIVDHFDVRLDSERPGRSLVDIAGEPFDADRVVFSEYHAIGAVDGGFMVRNGRYKLIHYVGFEPELFDLDDDPDELVNLAGEPAHADVLAGMRAALDRICDTDAVNRLAHEDQAALIASFGGREAALKLGNPGATPPPKQPAR
jgi:choline-sulfatase